MLAVLHSHSRHSTVPSASAMWPDIDKKAEAIMRAVDADIRASEVVYADLEPPWDGENTPRASLQYCSGSVLHRSTEDVRHRRSRSQAKTQYDWYKSALKRNIVPVSC